VPGFGLSAATPMTGSYAAQQAGTSLDLPVPPPLARTLQL
jgi:hypothetical protein